MPSLDRLAHQALVANGFQPDMGEAVEREVASLHAKPPKGIEGARDLRSLLWSSIDNASSRDLDQIEVAEELADGGIVLRIGIADVAASRGTTSRSTRASPARSATAPRRRSRRSRESR